jgi:Tol biopolymer transport system component
VSELGLSPDSSTLSFVAPGSGSARELYVLNRRTLAYRQLSALGYASVLRPVWRPGGSEIAFLAAQTPDLPPDIYSAALDAQGQRLIWPAQGASVRDLAWNADGALLFFSAGEIYALDMAEGTVSPPLTSASGFGPDYGLTHSPVSPMLYYLKPFRDLATGAAGGLAHRISTADVSAAPIEQKIGDGFMERLVLSQDGTFLALASSTDVWVRELAFNTSVQAVSGAAVPPQPVFSPDNQQIAYIDLDAAGVPQVFVVDRLGGAPRQLTAHTYGSVGSLVWAAG